MHQTSPQNGSRDCQPVQVVLGIWIFLRARQFHQLIEHSADNIHLPGYLSYRVVNRKTANFGTLLLQKDQKQVPVFQLNKNIGNLLNQGCTVLERFLSILDLN